MKLTKNDNEIGLKNFATCFFNLQKTIPQDRYIEPKEEEIAVEETKIEIPKHVMDYLELVYGV